MYPLLAFAPTGNAGRRIERMRFPGSVSVTEKTSPRSPEKGVTGDPRRATAEIGRVSPDIKVQSAVAQIRALVGQQP